ncbi:MAG TPA: ribose-5-phosphate isomerase RpiA [Candidatus Acidoferrales bacterium]|nr:ribose-5-phosphate isomerase RpiA [Candidatus Acidoferrales bacterium]
MDVVEEKRAAGYAAVDRFVRAEMRCIGLGTGSTAFYAIERIGSLIAQGWSLSAVVTSAQTEQLCKERNIPVVGLCEGPPIAVAIDGADEVAPDFSLTKGGGGALFREKAVALAAQKFVVVVDESKLVPHLGRFPLPVEVVPFTLRYVEGEIAQICSKVSVRVRDGKPFITDNGNNILDCGFGTIDDPADLDKRLRAINGVVASGIFVGLTSHVLVGGAGGVREIERR